MADQSNTVLTMLEGLRSDLKDVRKDVRDIRRVLYGNGQTGFTTRLELLEQWRSQAKERRDQQRERSYEAERTWQDRWWDVARMVLAVVIGSLVSVVGLGAL